MQADENGGGLMNAERQSALQPRLYYRAKEVAMLLGLSLRTVYEGVYAGWIPSRKIGNSRLIPAVWLEATSDEEAQRIASHLSEEQGQQCGKSDNSGFLSDYRMQQLRVIANPSVRVTAPAFARLAA